MIPPAQDPKPQILVEPPRETPIVDEPDVLVVGGGSAGIAAAVAAARAGADTTLVERYGYLGGLATGGLIILLLTLDDGKGIQVIGGLCQEVVERLVQRKAAIYPKPEEWGAADQTLIEQYSRWGLIWGHAPHRVRYAVAYDPDVFKCIADDLISEARVRLRLHSWMSDVVVQDQRITHVICQSKMGRHAIKPKLVIDASGDGDVFASAQLPYESAQVHAWRWYRMGNVREIDAALSAAGGKFFQEFSGHFFYALGEGRTLMPWGFSPRTDRAIDPTSVQDLTDAEMTSRRHVMEQVEKLRATVPGFENAYLADMADQLGITETRRLTGAYVLDRPDEDRCFDDTIAVTGNWTKYGVRYYVPYRSLISNEMENLLVAGKCISVSKRVHHSTKEIPACMATGQAAGVAAALAVRNACTVQHLDVQHLRTELVQQGALLNPA